jgi:hypothetical protein
VVLDCVGGVAASGANERIGELLRSKSESSFVDGGRRGDVVDPSNFVSLTNVVIVIDVFAIAPTSGTQEADMDMGSMAKAVRKG